MANKIEISYGRLVTLAVIVAFLAFGVGRNYSGSGFVLGKPVSKIDFSSLNDIYGLLQRHYDGTLDQKKLLDGAKAGLAAAAGDPYTNYLDADANKALNDDLNGTLTGIGAEVAVRSSQLIIVAPVADSPAAKAGLRPNDAILKINDQDSAGLNVEEAVTKIRGAKDTTVKLSIGRGSDKPFDVTITRAVITVPSVKWSMKPNDVGYIQITQFGADTSEKIVQAASELKQQGAKKVVLDLRNDPGGYLDAAVKVSGQFLPEGKLVVEERTAGKTTEKLNSPADGQLVGLPMVVLINGGSASASEIVSGALHDNHAATLVGEKSFGKGSVQEVDKLAAGAALKITVAHWYTPNGVNISKEGIKPDVEVKMEQADVDAGRDPQLDKALEVLAAK